MWRLLKLVDDPNEIDVLSEKSRKQKTSKIFKEGNPTHEWETKSLVIFEFRSYYIIIL